MSEEQEKLCRTGGSLGTWGIDLGNPLLLSMV